VQRGGGALGVAGHQLGQFLGAEVLVVHHRSQINEILECSDCEKLGIQSNLHVRADEHIAEDFEVAVLLVFDLTDAPRVLSRSYSSIIELLKNTDECYASSVNFLPERD